MFLRQNELFVQVLTILHKVFKRIRKDKERDIAAGDLDIQWTELTHTMLVC